MRGQVQVDGFAPRPFDVFGVDHPDRAVVRSAGRDVEVVTVVVPAQVAGPHRADRRVQCRGERAPVHEVARVPEHDARIGVEGRERQVIVVAVLEDRRVRLIAGDDRIQEAPVAEVGVALALDASPPAQGFAAAGAARVRRRLGGRGDAGRRHGHGRADAGGGQYRLQGLAARESRHPGGRPCGQRMTRAPLPCIAASTSATRTIEVSPGVVIASAPWAAPYSTASCGPLPSRNP